MLRCFLPFLAGAVACKAPTAAEPCAIPPPQASLATAPGQQFWNLNTSRPQVIAHRGFACCFPENTITAITGAFDLAADAVEVDVRFTADGVPVLMHDASLERTTNGKGDVRTLDYRAVRQLDACFFNPSHRPCGVPTLVQALATARPRGPLLLDLKDQLTECQLRVVLDAVIQSRMEAQAPLISFHAQNLKRLRDLHAWIPLGVMLSQARDLPAIQTATAGAAFVPLSALADSSLNPLEEGGGIRIGVWTIANESQARLAVSRGIRWLVSDLPLTGLN